MKHQCKGCEKRTATCHSECEEYLAFHAENVERNRKKLIKSTVSGYQRAEVDKHLVKWRKRKK